MNIIYKVIIDLKRKNKSYTINIEENDNMSRVISMKIMDDGVAADLSEVTQALFIGTYRNDSATHIVSEACTIVTDEDGNKTNEIRYTIPGSITQVSTIINAKVELAYADDDVDSVNLIRVSSPEFYINVNNALYNESDYSSASDVTAIQALIAESNRLITSLQQKEIAIQGYINAGIKNPYMLMGNKDDENMFSYDGSEELFVEGIMNPHSLLIHVPDGVEIDYDGGEEVEWTIGGGVVKGETIKPKNVEFDTTSSAGNGGYIDFHFNGSEDDYTSRIIEDASGSVNIVATNGVKFNGSDPLEWVKKGETVTGTTVVTLPEKYHEINIVVNNADQSYPNIYSFLLNKLEVTAAGANERGLFSGKVGSGNDRCVVRYSTSGIHLQTLVENGQNVASTAKVSIYYR